MLRQHKYILDILTQVGMTSSKPVGTLIFTSKVTILPDPLFSNPTQFCQIVDVLQYLTFKRPDIYFAINIICQFMHAPSFKFSLADDTAEVIWLRYLFRYLQIHPAFAPTIWCDNLGATYLSANSIFDAHTKHIEVDYHFV
jgi:hypothetical protein